MLPIGENEIWLLGCMCRWTCALYNANCSRVVVRCSALYVGSAREASGQAVLVYGRDPKVTSFGSWDMYSFALRGRVMGLHCMTLLIWKQLQSASYKVSGMCHGSSCSSCCFLFWVFVKFSFFDEGLSVGGGVVSEYDVR